jgi:transposase
VDTPRLETEVFEMPGFRVPYPSEFRRQMVELVRSGRTPQDLGRAFEPNAHSVRQSDHEAGERRNGGTTGAGREELSKLRRENHRLRQERDIVA